MSISTEQLKQLQRIQKWSNPYGTRIAPPKRQQKKYNRGYGSSDYEEDSDEDTIRYCGCGLGQWCELCDPNNETYREFQT